MAKSNNFPRYLFLLGLLVALVMVFLIVRPFITSILTGVFIAYVTYPLFSHINKLIKHRNISALITSIFIIIIILLPLILILNIISKEAYIGYIISKQKIVSGNIFTLECNGKDNLVCNLSARMKEFLANPRNRYYIEDAIAKISSYIINTASSFVLMLPMIIINFFIMVFVLFYLYRDGKEIFDKIENLIPIKKQYKQHILSRINQVTYAVVYGQIVIAIAQGTLGGIGFWIFGVPSPILWGIVMALMALIPWVGPPIVWFPAALYHIIEGYSQADNSLITKGVLLILYGMIVIGTIDNILKPKLIGERGGIHPILALIGVIGGLKLFGFAGILIGPIILAVFMTLVKIYEEEKDLFTIVKK